MNLSLVHGPDKKSVSHVPRCLCPNNLIEFFGGVSVTKSTLGDLGRESIPFLLQIESYLVQQKGHTVKSV